MVKRKLLLALCVLIVIGYLIVGLWPFEFNPDNRVIWLGNGEGIALSHPSILYSEKPVDLRNGGGSVSVEICLRPAEEPAWGFTKILSLSEESVHRNLFVAQRGKDLWLQLPIWDKGRWNAYDQVWVKGALQRGVRRFVAVTAGTEGTDFYVDGVLARSYPKLKPRPSVLRGYVVLGGIGSGNRNWEGRLYGAAIFDRTLSASDIGRHYSLWSGDERRKIAEEEGLSALYFFNEKGGSVIRDYGPAGATMRIGAKYELRDRSVFPALWRGGYSRVDIAINLLGFVPFGFCYFLYRKRTYPGRLWGNIFVTLIIAAAVSATIETLQIWLPVRSPSYLDLICNISGAAGGIFLTLTHADKTPTHAEKI